MKSICITIKTLDIYFDVVRLSKLVDALIFNNCKVTIICWLEEKKYRNLISKDAKVLYLFKGEAKKLFEEYSALEIGSLTERKRRKEIEYNMDTIFEYLIFFSGINFGLPTLKYIQAKYVISFITNLPSLSNVNSKNIQYMKNNYYTIAANDAIKNELTESGIDRIKVIPNFNFLNYGEVMVPSFQSKINTTKKNITFWLLGEQNNNNISKVLKIIKDLQNQGKYLSTTHHFNLIVNYGQLNKNTNISSDSITTIVFNDDYAYNIGHSDWVIFPEVNSDYSIFIECAKHLKTPFIAQTSNNNISQSVNSRFGMLYDNIEKDLPVLLSRLENDHTLYNQIIYNLDNLINSERENEDIKQEWLNLLKII